MSVVDFAPRRGFSRLAVVIRRLPGPLLEPFLITGLARTYLLKSIPYGIASRHTVADMILDPIADVVRPLKIEADGTIIQ